MRAMRASRQVQLRTASVWVNPCYCRAAPLPGAKALAAPPAECRCVPLRRSTSSATR